MKPFPIAELSPRRAAPQPPLHPMLKPSVDDVGGGGVITKVELMWRPPNFGNLHVLLSCWAESSAEVGNDNSGATVRACAYKHHSRTLSLCTFALPLTALTRCHHHCAGFKHDHYHHVCFLGFFAMGGGPRFKYKQDPIHFVLKKVPWTQSPLVVVGILINYPSWWIINLG